MPFERFFVIFADSFYSVILIAKHEGISISENIIRREDWLFGW
jgi:hypothetical protein